MNTRIYKSTFESKCYSLKYSILSLFIDDARLNNGIKEHLSIDKKEDNMLKIFPYENIDKEVKELAGKGKRIWVCPRNLFNNSFLYLFILPF